jgi:hypothetical protein
MKFGRLFFLENLKKITPKSNFLLFFKFQPMSAKQWFSLRALFKQGKLDLVVLKKREVLKFLGIQKSLFTLDVDNVCFVSSTNFLFLSRVLGKKTFIADTYLRPFLFVLGSQFLSVDYLKGFFFTEATSMDSIFLSNFISSNKNLYFLKLNLSSNINLFVNIKILNLKD